MATAIFFKLISKTGNSANAARNQQMATNPAKRQVPKPTSSVIRWLLDSDPSIGWQALRDLTDAPDEEVAAERARVATEGAGARLLALQASDGRWGGAAWNRGWDSTMHVLSLLREMGLDPASDQARRAVGLVRDSVTWRGCGPEEADDNTFFAGEVEPCINGQVAARRSLFRPGRPGHHRPAARRATGRRRLELRGTQRFESVVVQHHDLRARGPARARAGERRQPGGDGGPSPWAGVPPRAPPLPPPVYRRGDRRRVDALCLPDLVALRRSAGARVPALRRVAPDERVAEAIDLVASKRDDDGRWPLETRYPGKIPVETDEGEGRPSRWNTLRAWRVLDWYSARDSFTHRTPSRTGVHSPHESSH